MRNRIVHGGMGFLKVGNADFKFVGQYRQYLTLLLQEFTVNYRMKYE